KKRTEKEFYEGVWVVRSGIWKKWFSQSISFSFWKELKRMFRDFRPEIVHLHTPNPLSSLYVLPAIPRKTKLIVHWHSDIIEQGALYTFFRPIEKLLLRRADQIIVTSPAYSSGSKALQPWPNKLQVVANTINREKLTKQEGDDAAIAAIRKRYEGKKIIFAFGRHVPYKGFRYLIDSAPMIAEDAVIVLAGSGPLTEQLKQRVASPNVYFAGRISDNELRQYLYAADLFVFPSITRNEAFGLALAEAMYCGLPAVTFTIPDSGVNWVSVNGETGLEVENGNAQALAGAINRLLADDALRAQLGRQARARAERYFVTEAIHDTLNDLYR
ncbi:MAG: glycosyltransferase, partial [Dysgonamonadaceae bacterium]|nr:glycosyltransferase [Dysgonamonadaceae bacterium]